MSDLQEIPRRDILEYIKTYSIRYIGCLTGEVFQDAIKEIERLRDELKRAETINDALRVQKLLLDERIAELEDAKGDYFDREDENRWISVEDQLPEIGKRVLLNVIINGKPVVTTGWQAHYGLVYLSDRFGTTVAEPNEVTHWMPLPEPPKEDDTR